MLLAWGLRGTAMEITFNGVVERVDTLGALDTALDRFDHEPMFELWLVADSGPSLSMLRNGEDAWLMYLHFNGDAGMVSKGDPDAEGVGSYRLSNGQVDEYPRSWFVDLEQCYKALFYFFVNDGRKYEQIEWQEV